MRRRDLFALLALTVSASAPPAPWALASDKIWHIGFLDLNRPPTPDWPSLNLRSFQRGLNELGYEEGRNYVIEARFADTDSSRLPSLAKELVDSGVDVIVTIGNSAVRAAKQATTTIPIVMAGANDPVGNGFVTSLAHPGGNVTGLTRVPVDSGMMGKGLQIFKQLVPNTSRLAILGLDNPTFGLKAAAEKLDVVLLEHDVSGVESANDFDAILDKIVHERPDAVFVTGDFVNAKYQYVLQDFIWKNRLPSMFEETQWVKPPPVGLPMRPEGLFSYFTDIFEVRRRAAFFVNKIFKGAKPADLPVEQPTRFKLVINLKTAKALGLAVPESLLTQADEVIE
jgi:putative ABC transport system substrate-binding protein